MSGARTGAGAFAAIVAAGATLAMGPACGTDPIVIAKIPLVEAGPVPCALSTAADGGSDAEADIDAAPSTCPSGQFCEPPAGSCGAAEGTCQAVPTACTLPDAFECGCDGVTYFNDCTRQIGRVGLSAPGVCLDRPVARTCGSSSGQPEVKCPDASPAQSVCTFVFPSAFRMFATYACFPQGLAPAGTFGGTCWTLPPPPGPSTAMTQFKQLVPSGTGTQMAMCQEGPCTDALTALRAGDGNVFLEATAADCP